MKIRTYKKQLIIAMHLLFWMISINVWYFVFNPTISGIRGNDYWPSLILLNCLFFLFCLLPFIWCFRNTHRWIKITLTVIFLGPLIYLISQLIVPTLSKDDISIISGLFISAFLYTLVFHFTIAAAVYCNLKILISAYLANSRFFIYSVSLLALICVTALANFALYDYCIDKVVPNLYYISYYKVWELLIIVSAYLVFTTIVFLVWQYAQMLIANREKAQNELLALKAQINPHFLFNNLNTIYSLASKKDARTKDVILQLSDFLRYVLYDTSSESIPLEKEAEIIRTYVDLQKERVNSAITQVELIFNGNFGNAEITPLLLLPLAENCFKHGIGKEPGKIAINIGFDGKQLKFTTENTIALREKTGKEENGGIGISNVEKRLNLLYPNRHTIHFEAKDGVFKVELKVELKV